MMKVFGLNNNMNVLLYVTRKNCWFHMFRTSAFSFNSQYLLLSYNIKEEMRSSPNSFQLPPMEARRVQFFSQNPFDFSALLFRSVLFSPICPRMSPLVTFSEHFVFSILVQQDISKFSKYFRSNFFSVQVFDSKYLRSNFLHIQISEPYNLLL